MSGDLDYGTGREVEGELDLFSLAEKRLRDDMIVASVYLDL